MQPKLLKLLLRILQIRPQLCHIVILMTGLTLTSKVVMVSERLIESMDGAKLGESISIASAHAASASESPTDTAPKEAESDKRNSDDTENFDPLALDENQVRVLKALAEKKESDSDNDFQREKSLMELSEKKINQQLTNLEKIKNELKSKKDLLTSEEKENVQKMAKIYEAMKPDQAAPIFNKMDTFVLAQIVKAMNQKKSSQILAIMDPAKAQNLTIEMLRVQPLQVEQKM